MIDKFNILFYTTSQPIPTVGGVERATITTASLLKSSGHKVFSIFKGPRNSNNTVFEDECSLQGSDIVGQIKCFLKVKEIDVIIIQTAFSMVKAFRKAAEEYPCKIFAVYHFEPIWDKQFVNFGLFYSVYKSHGSVKNLLKLIGFPILKIRHLIICYMSFRQGYRLSDRTVLLSSGHISSFLKYVGGDNDKKIAVIPNAIPNNIPDYEYQPSKKEKMLLIVARLDEKAKRISLALELWKEINEIVVNDGWSLVIVGDGEARSKYEKYISINNLRNVTLEGRQEPWDYYKRASIFLMTSRSEGWGITLLEAQKFGVVPVCYNTFAAAQDVINDKISGFLVQEGDKQKYKKTVLSLMKNSELCSQMAFACIEHVKRFSQETVREQWNQLLYDVMADFNVAVL